MLELEGLVPREDVAVVVVDIQEKLFGFIHEKERVLENSKKVIEFCQRIGLQTFVTEQYPKGLGVTLPELQQTLGANYTPIPKTAFSCLGEPAFMEALEGTEASTLVLLGIETHICVLQTAITALASGNWDVMILSDAVGSRTVENHRLGLDRARDEGAIIASSEMFFYEILQEAKTEDHKKVFDLLK
ncbi:MAG: isochorismatase family protein [Deltaproteobacteria bacterium]|nr:isochorismatase family protein [Deltaproteobacteria bacterium]